MKIQRTRNKDALATAFAAKPTIEEEVELQKLTVVEELLQFLRRSGIKRSELAERMGVRTSRITAMLDGSANLTIESLVRAGRAVGADLKQTFVPAGEKGHWISVAPITGSRDRNCIAVSFPTRRVHQAPSPRLHNPKPADRDAEDAA
jgi:transcriptional regulator with XRE-family HTH domain